jgi:hypothetical protein
VAPTFDPFKILGIDRDATDDEVKRAYRTMAAKYHPDAGGDVWVFQQVLEAYETILRQRSKSGASSASSATSSTSGSAQPKASKSPSQAAASGPSHTAAGPTKEVKSGSLLWRVFASHLPLQNETTLFILVNVLDIFMTYTLLRLGGLEANPIANFFFRRWNVQGMVFFKMTVVAIVTILAQAIARYNLLRAKQVLILGTIIVVIVVLYSGYLLARLSGSVPLLQLNLSTSFMAV